MAEFPPNLDDGELWLPSDIFPQDVPNNRPLFMDDLAHQFTTFTLLQRDQPTSFPPPMFEQRLRPPVHSPPVAHSSHGYLTASRGLDVGHSLTAYETGALSSVRPRPLYQYNLLEPAQNREVESILQLRSRGLQSQQNRTQTRLLPIQGNRVRVGSFATKSAGTGVFLPRAASTTITTNEVGKKQGVRNKRETQIIQPRNSTSRIVMGKHDDFHYQLSPEMALPQDWTY